MDPLTDFLDRLSAARLPLTALFAAGFVVALWDPKTKVVLTLALGPSLGMLVLGPYAAAALYATRLQRRLGGYLRWPICLLLSGSAVMLLDALLGWTGWQLLLAGVSAAAGTVFGHDATLAVLELKSEPGARVDKWMVLSFPLLVGAAVLAGYCALGFFVGTWHMVAGFWT